MSVGIDENLVNIQDVCFERGGRRIFNNVNIQIRRGKITAIMGPSGTGKTTLLQLIGGQLQPSKGIIQINESIINQLSQHMLYKVRRNIGILFQSSALFTDLTVFENVAFPLREHTELDEVLIHHLVLMKLHAVGLRGAHHLMPSQLSGGMARRAALARAIALDPALIMYDEPFSGQDPISMGVIVRLIKRLNDALGMTTILVSHDVQETLSIADYVYVIADGCVVGEGSPKELMETESPQVKQFIQGLPDGVVPFHYPALEYQQDLLASRPEKISLQQKLFQRKGDAQ